MTGTRRSPRFAARSSNHQTPAHTNYASECPRARANVPAMVIPQGTASEGDGGSERGVGVVGNVDNRADEGVNSAGRGDSNQHEDVNEENTNEGVEICDGDDAGDGDDCEDVGDGDNGGEAAASDNSERVQDSSTIPVWLRAPEPVFVDAPTTWRNDWKE
ncbi:uncharacterized protein IUM83_02122 [Phytophthora cinnamomi]|uniref:uncharacterized protein n=1 Tax=Phytophthora cinnamomi TaxID=4785 RepID=UPI003559CC9C|nr:hypothetical protein IUM83_02122 [Phytophthora cinnamomi]